MTLGRDPGTGKQVQKSIYGATQKEVRQRMQKILVEVDEVTVGEWMDIWKGKTLLLYREKA